MADWKYNEYPGFLRLKDLAKTYKKDPEAFLNRFKKFDLLHLCVQNISKSNGSKNIIEWYIKEEDVLKIPKEILEAKSLMEYRYCEHCKEKYFATDVKQKYCTICTTSKIPCKCGCEKLVKSIGSGYAPGHKNKGKSYQEIYHTSTSACGFRKREANIAKNSDIKKKISDGLKRNYIQHPEVKSQKTKTRLTNYPSMFYGQQKFVNSIGELYRSSLEVQFSELLLEHNIPYLIEPRMRLIDGSYKVIDFVVDNIIIEISGYAYKEWRESFVKKMHLVRQSCSNLILVFTYPEYLIPPSHEDKERISIYDIIYDQDTFCDNIYDKERILQKIAFCQRIMRSNIENGFSIPNDFILFNQGTKYFYNEKEGIA